MPRLRAHGLCGAGRRQLPVQSTPRDVCTAGFFSRHFERMCRPRTETVFSCPRPSKMISAIVIGSFSRRYFPKSPSRSSRSTKDESINDARFTFFALGLDSAMTSKRIFIALGSA